MGKGYVFRGVFEEGGGNWREERVCFRGECRGRLFSSNMNLVTMRKGGGGRKVGREGKE